MRAAAARSRSQASRSSWNLESESRDWYKAYLPLGKSLTTMDKTGRNEPCPCGSGKKYKKCCLPMHEADERQRLAEQQADREQRAREVRATIARELASFEDEIDELTAASNAVIDLVRAGKLDEAEQAARELIVRFPDVHDGYDHLGSVHHARGENQQAADCYRNRPHSPACWTGADMPQQTRQRPALPFNP